MINHILTSLCNYKTGGKVNRRLNFYLLEVKNMIKYIILAALYALILSSAYYGIPKHIEIMKADRDFNECLQDLSYQECRLGIYGE